MTKEELAAKLNGREYLHEITKEEEQAAKEAGLVVVFGASDDLCEFRGAIHDETGCWIKDDIYFTHKGLLESDCDCGDLCPYFEDIKSKAPKITAIWDQDGYSWVYECPFPHAAFDVMEEGEKYCRGIVFELPRGK